MRRVAELPLLVWRWILGLVIIGGFLSLFADMLVLGLFWSIYSGIFV